MAKYRVWNVINPPRQPRVYPVESPLHARTLTDALAKSQLLDDAITDNEFGFEAFEDGEWCEWYDDNGNDLDEHFRMLDEEGKEA